MKYIWYKGYSAFFIFETDFLIFRRFSPCNHVAVLEEKLGSLDREHEKRECEDVHNGSFRDEAVEERERVLCELKGALVEYNAFMLQQSSMKKFPAAPRVDIKSLKNWHYNHNELAVSQEEQAYLKQAHDLFSLDPRDKSPLRRLLDRSKFFRLHSIWRKKHAPELPLYDKKEVILFSDKKIDRFVTVVIVGVGMAMLIAPMWILQGLEERRKKLGVITLFVGCFLGVVSGATVAKPWEVLAATAAYSAVLMVFLQLSASNIASSR